MSGFIRSLADEELRVRNGQAFIASQQQAAGALSANCVLFNPAASTIKAIVTKIVICSSGGTGVLLFRLAADPAFGASNAIQNRLFGGGNAAQCLHEGAVAAAPATVGQLGQYQINTAAVSEVLAPSELIMPAGTGILLNMGTNAINISWTIHWYEVPS